MENYFELFNLKQEFDLDLLELNNRYKKLQVAAHPDNAVQVLKAIALKQSSYINEAYRVLSSPILRATYLLDLAGIDINIELNSNNANVFLEQQFLLREELLDNGNDMLALRVMADKLKAKLSLLWRDLSVKFTIPLHHGQVDYTAIILLIKEIQFSLKAQEEIEKNIIRYR